MPDDDIKVFIPEEKFLQVGKKRFKIWNSSGRAFEATAMFNKLATKGTDERKAITTDYDMFSAWIDICLLLIRQKFIVMMKQNFRISTVFDWLRRERLSKKYLMDNLDIKELTEFVDNALEPILGTKKKEMEKEQKMLDVLEILAEKLGAEALAELLLSSLPAAGIKKVM